MTGAQLDLWVARAEGKCYTTNPREWGNALINDLGRLSIAKTSWDCAKYFEPSSNWGHGGPIIERERIAIWRGDAGWSAILPGANGGAYPGDSHYIDARDDDCVSGSTPLIAAMRAYVASKFGDEVQP
nr:phage protein NinX family protein [Burkholderia sp. Ac-20349]